MFRSAREHTQMRYGWVLKRLEEYVYSGEDEEKVELVFDSVYGLHIIVPTDRDEFLILDNAGLDDSHALPSDSLPGEWRARLFIKTADRDVVVATATESSAVRAVNTTLDIFANNQL